jgi:hypothetical protein
MIGKADLAVVGIKPRRTEKIYDKSAIIPGNHLRWNFDPEMGFPKDGFVISRYDAKALKFQRSSPTYYIQDRPETRRYLEKTWSIKLPGSKSDALNRLAGSHSRSTITNRYNEPADDLLRIINRLESMDHREEMYSLRIDDEETSSGLKQGLRIMDVLMTASVDPYIARMLGLYLIDETAQANRDYVYSVTGLWGNVRFPSVVIKFPKFSIPTTVLPITFSHVKVSPANGAAMSFLHKLDNDFNEEYLTVSGDTSDKKITLDFETAVEELTVAYSGNVRGIWKVYSDGEQLEEIVDNGDVIRISRVGEPFSSIEFSRIPNGLLHITEIKVRKKVEPIGRVSCATYVKHEAGKPVPLPIITNLTPKQMPSLLNENGEISNKVSQVHLSTFVHMPYISNIFSPDDQYRIEGFEQITASNRPVRIQFSRSKQVSRQSNVRPKFRNISSPAMYTDITVVPSLPSLLGHWSLDGTYTNHKDGTAPMLHGNSSFVKPVSNTMNFQLRMNGKEALRLKNQPDMTSLGDKVTLQATINVSNLCTNEAAIIATDKSNGFWWGIAKTGETFNQQVWINGRNIVDSQALPTHTTWRLCVIYDGDNIRFFYGDGTSLASTEPHPATFGRINTSQVDVVIGATGNLGNLRLQSLFTGEISKVSIWQQLIHPSEAEAALLKTLPYLKQQESVSKLVYRDMATYQLKSSDKIIRFGKSPPLRALENNLSMFLWVMPSNNNVLFPTLLGNDYKNGFWLGLQKVERYYYFRIWFHNNRFQSIGKIAADEWSHVGLSFSASTITIFVNGKQDSQHTTSFSTIHNNDIPIGIGCENTESSHLFPVNVLNGNKKYPFNGYINDIQFWREAITPVQWQQRMSTVQAVDQFLDNGMYAYRAQAIDLFGRVSKPSPIKKVKTIAKPIYNAPVNLHSGFIPLTGQVVSVTPLIEFDTDANEEIKIGYRIVSNIAFNRDIEEHLMRYDIKIKRLVYVPKAFNEREGDWDTVEELVEQPYEIALANQARVSGRAVFEFEVKLTPFEQLNPSENDRIEIEFDYHYYLKFVWTGLQELNYREIRHFNLYQQLGLQNEISQAIVLHTNSAPDHSSNNVFTVKIATSKSLQANTFSDYSENSFYCLIGAHKFEILSNTRGRNPTFRVKYGSVPVVRPETGDVMKITLPEGHPLRIDYADENKWQPGPVAVIPIEEAEPFIITPSQRSIRARSVHTIAVLADDERSRLLRQGIDWLPESALYKITIKNIDGLSNYQQPDTESYIPAAIVFFDSGEEHNKWRSFYVAWHSLNAAGTLDLFTMPGEKNESLPELVISTERPLKLFVGQSFEYHGQLPTAPIFIAGKPTVQYHLALLSEDELRIKSKLSPQTSMVAVNRKRPFPAPTPNAEIISKADYFGKSTVSVTWDRPLGASANELFFYKVYRATDSDIYTRDLEQRRAQMGFYKNLSSLAEVFKDDVDFTDWLATQADFDLDDLFPNQEQEALQFKAVTPLWRAWADRYYSALNDHELMVIGQRQGNEIAFKLLTGKPIKVGAFTDEINGLVSNRYYYRIKSMSESLAENLTWGKLSHSITPIAAKTPRKPVFTKIEAYDRQVTLNWSLNREPNFKEYLLYRAETKEELKDLRWWSTEPDERVVATIPDPRLLTSGNALTLPYEIDIAEVLGVYRQHEFNAELSPVDIQPQAMNYFKVDFPESFIAATEESAPHQVNELRRIADGVAMVVVYRVGDSDVQVLHQKHHRIPFTDVGLVGLRDYYYRLVAVNKSSVCNIGNEIILTRPLEIALPTVPIFYVTRESLGVDIDEIFLNIDVVENTVEYKVQKFNEITKRWQKGKMWNLLIPTEHISLVIDQLNTTEVAYYRIKVRTLNHLYSGSWINFSSSPGVT